VKATHTAFHKSGRHFKAPSIEFTLAVAGKEKALALFASFFTAVYDRNGIY